MAREPVHDRIAVLNKRLPGATIEVRCVVAHEFSPMKTKPRAVIDTNLFYYALGFESDSRLRDDWVRVLDARCMLAVASPTVVEVLTRPDLTEAQRWQCLDAIISRRFGDIVQIGFLTFDLARAMDLTRARDAGDLRSLCDEARSLKINCEAAFLRFVTFALVCQFQQVACDIHKSRLSPEQRKYLSVHLKVLLEANIEETLTKLRSALVEAYEGEKPIRSVECAMQSLISAFAHATLVNVHIVAEGHRIDEVPSGTREQIGTAVHSDLLYREVAGSEHPLRFLHKKRYRANAEAFLSAMRGDFAAHDVMPAAALEFFIDRLATNLDRGAIFRKNDVVDLLLAFSLTASDTLFVSNDNAVVEALRAASPVSHALSMSLRR